MNILTFDIEEWFHVFEDHNNTPDSEWLSFEKRLPFMMDSILDFLKSKNVKATFFCMGWIVREYPEVIKKISARGFEVGSHSDLHKLAFNQTKKQYELDLKASIDSIEQLIGEKVKSYRAPGFSITGKNLWAFESLIKNGIEYDSSIFPVERKLGGIKGFPKNKPFIINTKSGILKEFPMNSYNIGNNNIVFSGGGFFRILPYPIIRKLVKNSDYVMTYLHPRDFDNDQPFNTLSLLRHIKSRIGTKGSLKKLENLIDNFDFVDLNQAVSLVDWSKVETIKL